MKLWSLRCFDFCCFVLEFLVLFILHLFSTVKRANICFFYFFTHGASNGLGRWLTMQAWRPGLDPQREALVWWRPLGSPLLESRQEDPWGLLISQLKAERDYVWKTDWRKSAKVDLLLPHVHTHVLAFTGAPPQNMRMCTQTASRSLISPWLCLLCVPRFVLFLSACRDLMVCWFFS